MAKDILVQWYRGGSDAGHRQSTDVIALQLDNMAPQEAAFYQGSEPYFKYIGYVYTTRYSLQYQDLLIDTINTDPRTGTFTRYRIIGDVESFPDNHMEMPLARMEGT